MSFASIVDRCDNFRHAAAAAPLAEFRLAPDAAHVLGLLCPDVVAALHRANAATPDWDIRTLPSGRTLVTFASALATPAARTRALGLLTASWRDAGLFAHVLAPRLWRDELYPVYADPFAPRPGTEAAFVVERAACALFGLVTYGVHMTMYTPEPDTGMRIWVPTRARTKQTWPLCLDNTVAGGVPHGLSPFEALVKECAEEAGLDRSLVEAHTKPCGAVSYVFRSPHGYVQPEIEFVYDLPIPPGRDKQFVPRPSDGEVQSFQLVDLEDVVAKMHEGLFKPNSALVLVDFLIRHGKITPENEPRYLDIVTRLHGRFKLEGVL